jgi:hypothetical protein
MDGPVDASDLRTCPACSKRFVTAKHVALVRSAHSGAVHGGFSRGEYSGGRDRFHHLRVTSLDDLDEEVPVWLSMAYEVGCQPA